MKEKSRDAQIIRSLNRQLRMSLNTIMGMANFLQESNLDEEQEQYVSSIKAATDKMLENLDQTLKIEHVLRNRINLEPTNIHLADFLQEFCNKYTIGGQTVTFDIHPNTPEWIRFDKEAMLDMITGIASFLLKHTANGSAAIQVRKTQEVGSRFFMKVEISAKHTQAEFLMPGQLEMGVEEGDLSTYTGDFQLMIALKLMEHLKIKPRVKRISAQELAVEFFVLCEQHVHGDQQQEHDSINLKDLRFNAHVLIVEDVQLNQIVTRLMLENYGCTVEIAENGREALNMFQPDRYDCIIMDIEMPVMDGIEATQAIKRSHSNVPPIIGLSANAMQKDAKWGVSEGLDDYITKPVKKETLAIRLYKWIPHCAVKMK